MTSWEPVDLGPVVRAVLAGDTVGPAPNLLPRTDGQQLMYPGELHVLAGEPESGKGWIALAEAARLIRDGKDVLYLDFEDTPSNVVGRLIALAAPTRGITRHLTYARPDDPFSEQHVRALVTPAPHLAIVDGLTEAYALLGLRIKENDDAAHFLRRLARPIAQTGAAVLLIDHVAKDRETRGRFAIGAGHKLAGVAATYLADTIVRPSRTHTGTVKLTLAKDRHGAIPGQRGVTIAIATITPRDGGTHVTVTLDPPPSDAQADDDSPFRPTTLMVRVSDAITEDPGLSRRQVRQRVKGKNDYIDLALDLLVSEGYVDRRQDGRATRHYPARPFEGPDRAPVPERAPSVPGHTTVPPCPDVPPSYKEGHANGHAPRGTPPPPATQNPTVADLDRADTLLDRHADLHPGGQA